MLGRLLAAATLSTALFACASPEQPVPLGDCEGCDEEVDSTINGMAPQDYYGLLIYAVDQERSVTPFRKASTFDGGPDLENGREVSVDLYLLDDGRFFMLYEEEERVSSSELSVELSEMHEGQWSIDGLTLVLGDIATAQGVDFSGSGGTVPGLAVGFNRDLGSPGLAGQVAMLPQTFSSAGLFHELGLHDDGTCNADLGEYCAYNDDCGPCDCGDGICQSAFDAETAFSCPSDCDR
jgi:hypothetical protein